VTGPLLDVLGVLAIVVLTVGTAIFVAAEFSLTALERSQVDSHVRRQNDRRAKKLQQAHRTLSFQLSGAQIGITLTTLTTGYLAEPLIAGWLSPVMSWIGLPEGAAHGVAVAVALLLANFISMLFGELVPKNIAISKPLATARRVAGFQVGFASLLRWLINGLNAAANWLVRRLGVEPADELASARSPQELGSLVRTSAAHGTLDVGTAKLLDRSLRFGDRTADELMTPRVQVHALRADADVDDLIDLARTTGFSRFPVYADDLDDVQGVVHVKQVFGVPAAERATTPMSSLAAPVPTVPESLDGDTLLERLRGSGLQLALVVDELAEATGFRMPEGEYETLAGLVLSRLGRIPEVNDEVIVDGWQVTVMRMDRHRVAELRVAKIEKEDVPAEAGAR
jgi:CBS domain containing-hemolysin-like protein